MADKVTFAPITSFTNDSTATTQTNANYVLMQNGLDNTISRDGTQPNQMNANIDMNNNHILNLPSPSSLFEPLRLIDVSAFASGTATFNTMPVGGNAGQVLTKNSSSNYDTSWQVPSDPVFSSSTAGDVPASGGGTTNFLRADGAWTAISGTTGNGVPTILISPSGDTTGATDTPAINNAITTASTNGYGFVVLKEGNYYINSSIIIKSNTHLIGNGHVGLNLNTVINMVSSLNAPGILVQASGAPVQGWSVEKMQIITPASGTSATAITVDSSQYGKLSNLLINVNGNSQTGISFNPTQSSGGVGIGATNTITEHIDIGLGSTTSSTALSLSANNNLGNPSLIGNTTGNTFIDIFIFLGGGSFSQTAIYLGLCDGNAFLNTGIEGPNASTCQPTVIQFDYGAHSAANPTQPNGNYFYTIDCGFGINWSSPTSRIISTGTYSASPTGPNGFYGFLQGDGAVPVALQNTEYFGSKTLLVGSLGRIGYTVGAGSTVTQTTSVTTPVTINTPCGQITTVSAGLTSGTPVAFTVNNNSILTTDTVILNLVSDSASSANVLLGVGGITNGTFNIIIYPLSTVTQSMVIGYSFVRATTS